MPKIALAILLLLFANGVFCQSRNLAAVKCEKAPVIDGNLSDSVWQHAAVATDFITNAPVFGNKTNEKSVVKILYTDEAIYIGAYLYDKPSDIRTQLTSRDAEQFKDVDVFAFGFDTYLDRQNSFQFLVTPVNVQSDNRHSNGSGDYNWDAVWISKTAIVNDGWIAEIKIPYQAIRFAKKNTQDWGINFGRFIRRKNEWSYWNPVDPNVAGFVNQFGTLSGLQNIQPPLRLSFLPYVSAGYSTVPTNAGRVNTFMKNGGMDVKYGINESFTLDMTLIPDFGQVQSDNVILNLSPFEQQFNENRPFFTEGTELFNKAGIFYSRRIGATPSGYYSALQTAADNGYEIIKNPARTQLYNATKFSGRTKKNLGIGIFNAVTAPMHAEFKDANGNKIKMETEPLANYNIIVLDQALKNRSYVSLTNTNVIRNGSARDANVTAINTKFFNKQNSRALTNHFTYTSVMGANKHNGFRTYSEYSKINGKWRWQFDNVIESKNYDPNDLGILRSYNRMQTSAYLSFLQLNANKYFNQRNYTLGISYKQRFEPLSYSTLSLNGEFFHWFKNFWDATLEFNTDPFWNYDFFELRNGKKLKRPPYYYVGLYGSRDSRKKMFMSFGAGFAESVIENDPYYYTQLGLRYRFSPKLSIEWNGNRSHDLGNFGWMDIL